ncbi:MAG: SpoIIE family protein phosphatase [Spirochaetes bacterium]|nr:SpoIIE family protein phosphatase [Spirochaetota bacterium]
MTDIALDKKTAGFIKSFYLRFNLFTEGFSFFIVVPILLVYVWANIQLTPEQLVLFFKIVPPAFLFGIAFVLVNNLIVLWPILRYFKKFLAGKEVPDAEYFRIKKRFLRLPFIHAAGAFFRWLILLGNAILPFSLLSDATRPQIINMWMGAALCSVLGIASYFAITEIMVQNMISMGVFAKKIEGEKPPRVSLRMRLTVLTGSSVLLTVAVIVTFFFITVENNRIADTLMYVRIGIMIFLALVIGVFSPLLVIKTLRDKINIVVELLSKIGAGDLRSAAREVPIHDEISEIIFDVDDMKDKLRMSRDELMDLNINLEKKVAERTRELKAALEEIEAANNELEAMNDNLVRANRELEETERIRKKDLTLAATVQAAFLPGKAPVYDQYDIAYIYKPWAEVSGDFFDFYENNATLKGVGLFDVSGHGVSSGLLTLITKSIISRNFYSMIKDKIVTVMEHINNQLIEEIGQIDNYVTGILLRFTDDRFEYVNCAHPDIVFRSGSTGRVGMILEKPGERYRSFFLGVRDMQQSFPSLSVKLGSGDCLFLYTDCMIENENSGGQVFGETRIMESLRKAPEGDARSMLNHIINNFNEFHRGTEFKDDLTAILIKRR